MGPLAALWAKVQRGRYSESTTLRCHCVYSPIFRDPSINRDAVDAKIAKTARRSAPCTQPRTHDFPRNNRHKPSPSLPRSWVSDTQGVRHRPTQRRPPHRVSDTPRCQTPPEPAPPSPPGCLAPQGVRHRTGDTLLGPPTPRGCRRLQLRPMDSQISIAFIGGGNMATALAAGLAGRTCPAGNLHALDPSPDVQESWRARGAIASAT